MDVYRRVICLQAGGQGGCSLELTVRVPVRLFSSGKVALNTRLRVRGRQIRHLATCCHSWPEPLRPVPQTRYNQPGSGLQFQNPAGF